MLMSQILNLNRLSFNRMLESSYLNISVGNLLAIITSKKLILLPKPFSLTLQILKLALLALSLSLKPYAQGLKLGYHFFFLILEVSNLIVF